MRPLTVLLLFAFNLTCGNTIDAQGIHLPLYRRGGSFFQHGFANLSYLSRTLVQIEARYARTYTDVEENRIVRRWHDGPHGADDYLLDGAGSTGSWYTILQVGNPPQALEVDIDMLSPDFYTIMTTSGKGSKYDTFASSSHESSQEHIHPTCLKTTELFHLPILDSSSLSSTVNTEDHPEIHTLRMPFPICQPPKYTYQTLFSSGSIVGLAPTHNTHSPLHRLNSPSLLTHLLSTNTISQPLVHITLLTPTEGLLSLGTPPTYLLEYTKVTLDKLLSLLASSPFQNEADRQAELEREVTAAMNFLVPEGSSPDTHFTWTDSGGGGVRGWHTGLISGVWVNGVKVLKNQAVVFDVNCPVILVPKGVWEVIFGGAGGMELGRTTEDEEDSAREIDMDVMQEDKQSRDHGKRRVDGRGFWAYPCLNVPVIEVEVGGWRFPIAAKDEFSLGKVDMSGDGGEEEVGTGYCISVIVGTDMGDRSRWVRSGMKDVWVLGEPFFRSVGVVFDFGGDGKQERSGRVGLRRY